MAAGDHEDLKNSARVDVSQQSEVRENFKRITEAEEVIVRSVAIPSLNQEVSISDELKKEA